MKPRLSKMIVVTLLLTIVFSLNFRYIGTRSVFAAPTWPSPWIEVDWDRNENGWADDWRDVEYAYYQYDNTYLYLKLHCYGMPGSEWPSGDGRYKWFIDLDNDMYYHGGNVYNAECLLFVEDTDHNGVGETYLLFDANHDGSFSEYEPWPPANYANYKVTDSNIGGFRIVPPNQIEMYIKWASIGTPSSYWLLWSTDQQNPNLDQSPNTDRPDEEQPISVHNVAAIDQTPTPTVLRQGENVSIQVVVENKGTLAETFNVTCYFNNTAIGTKLVTNLAAGHQITITYDWNTTGIPAGNYTIKAWADSSAAITETNEVDNWCTAPAMVTVQPAPVHDVAAISQDSDKTSVINGTIVNINVTVSNLGDFPETFNVTCSYNGHPISYQTVTNLAQKTSTSIIFAWNTTDVQPNTYYIHGMADSSYVITEVDENNNNCTSFVAVTVYSPGQMGKLFVDKVKTAVISGQDPPVVGLPTVYEFTIIVTNIGGSNVSNVTVNETISSNVSFLSAGTPSQGSIIALPPPKIVWNVGTLVPGANATLTFRVSTTTASPGLLYLNHKEDITASGTDTFSGNTVTDSGHTDTTVTAIVRDVAAISQIPTSTVVCQGDTIAIDVTVKNFGNVTETFDVACYYDSTQIGVLRVYNLGAGGQTTISFAWDTTGVPPGTYAIKAEADSSHEITESNETNNVCTSPSTVRIVIHDIAIISQNPSPTTVVQGETITIEVIVKNEGTEPETFNVSCYYNETLLETKTVTNLQPNTTSTLSFLWNTAGVTLGLYYINTAASTVPGEKDTSDNACRSSTSVTVTLSISASINPTSARIKIGESVTFTSSVSGGSSPYSYQWYLNGSAVPSATSSTWTFAPTSLQPIGNYTVYVIVTDRLMHTAQSNIAIVTVAPQLTAHISPTAVTIFIGQSVTFTPSVSGGYPPYINEWYVDGTLAKRSDPYNPGDGHILTYVFTPTATGIYYVHLKVIDSTNNTAQSETARIVVQSIAVGGYSISLGKETSASQTAAYAMLVTLFGAMLSLRKRARKSTHALPN